MTSADITNFIRSMPVSGRAGNEYAPCAVFGFAAPRAETAIPRLCRTEK